MQRTIHSSAATLTIDLLNTDILYIAQSRLSLVARLYDMDQNLTSWFKCTIDQTFILGSVAVKFKHHSSV